MDSRSGGTRDQMEVCLDENGFLRRGQIIWLDLYVVEICICILKLLISIPVVFFN